MMLTQVKPLGQLNHKKHVTFSLGKDKQGNAKQHTLATNLFKQNYTPFSAQDSTLLSPHTSKHEKCYTT